SLAAATASSGRAQAAPALRPLVAGAINAHTLVNPEPTSQCLATLGIHCYAPGQFEKAYGLDTLHAHGIDGRGRTIAIVDAFGSPTIANDLHAFDQAFGNGLGGVPADPAILQDPKLTIIQPVGAVPPFDPTNSDMVGWATETTLDVEWAHVFAPKANILLVETPVTETEGVQGFPEIVQAENYVINHHLADVISQSFGATEETFPSAQSILDLRSAFVNAHRHHVTVLGGSGDTGATNYELDLATLYPMAVNSWPSSDPLVTSIGGTQLSLDDSGNRLSPDVVWNDGFGAGGGGVSSVFARPWYQNGVQDVTGDMRGTPDISLSSSVDGAVWLYYTFRNPGSPFHLVGGTSEATPEFAGIVAMADQVAHHDLGLINGNLYHLGYGANSGLVDVTSGDNSFAGVTGYSAGPGYDLASGLGTIDASKFVPALANADEQGDQDGNSQ
ncbi:MAG TPA: S53 family peptidase, partial [Gaiellaceae bacterium]|nr:S53 family peptidase [Gaiellaceae bacterium]